MRPHKCREEILSGQMALDRTTGGMCTEDLISRVESLARSGKKASGGNSSQKATPGSSSDTREECQDRGRTQSLEGRRAPYAACL